MSTFVLDASALLAYLQDEEGGSEVASMLPQRGTIGAANLAEALSKVAERGLNPRELVAELDKQDVLGGLLDVEALTIDDALVIGELRPLTKDHGLGLGDRACLALGLRLGVPVVTADRAWTELEIDALEVHSVRS